MKRRTLGPLGLLALTSSIAAHAEPTDNDLLTVVDDGAKLTVLSALNIPSHNKVIFQNGIQFNYFSQARSGSPMCRLGAENAAGGAYNRDIRVSPGRVLLQIDHYGGTNGAGTLVFGLSDGGKLHFDCFSAVIDGHSAGIATIGQFRRVLNGIATLELAAPLDL